MTPHPRNPAGPLGPDPGLKFTYQLAMALAREYATEHMACHGRVRWSEGDWQVAAQMFDDLMGEEGRQS